MDSRDDQVDSVLVQTAKPVLVPRFQESAFTEDEVVIYKEEQALCHRSFVVVTTSPWPWAAEVADRKSVV